MFTFFKKIRQNLLVGNRTSKYLAYAVGEIVLVVIGILIALQLNNWNAERLAQHELRQRLERIHEELAQTATIMKQRANYIDSAVVSKNTRTLLLLKAGSPDSLAMLNKTLDALPNVLAITFNLPVLEDFMNSGFIAKIDNPEMKVKLFNLKNALAFTETLEDYSREQLQNIIEPFLMQHINYAQITANKNLIPVHPINDYSGIAKKLEFENVVNLKLEVDRVKSGYLKQLSGFLESLDEDILNELKSN